MGELVSLVHCDTVRMKWLCREPLYLYIITNDLDINGHIIRTLLTLHRELPKAVFPGFFMMHGKLVLCSKTNLGKSGLFEVVRYSREDVLEDPYFVKFGLSFAFGYDSDVE